MLTQEYIRLSARGYGDGVNAGTVIGLPPVLNFGSPELQAKVVPEVFSGKKHICLAVSNDSSYSATTLGTKMTGYKIVPRSQKRMLEAMYSDYRRLPSKPRTESIGLSTATRNGSLTGRK